MPAFVANGPDIPERLLQAHEEGRVVFFCGAGISYPARLPGFGGLVKSLYSELGVVPSPVQQAAIKSGQYDTAIGLLEANIVGGRETVRGALVRILTPDLTAPKATTTHDALLTLARNRDGRMRLITTNFDRLFEEVFSNKALTGERFKAPLLPVPKNRWDGLVYLHGLVPTAPTAGELDRLVVSSGDFGLAYLTERWAARFVSELFRNYTVCFVGYSINDPVLRYMMDALAADRLLGEAPPEMYAFGSYSKEKEAKVADEWHAKNVTPILYREHMRHAYLHRTLHMWADTYRDGVRGKGMIITQHANTPPLASSRSDFAVGRVLWALTDGLVAKHFADMKPAPPLEWLEPLAERQFAHEDLARFGVIPNAKVDHKLSFSVIHRPAPYTQAYWMSIADMGGRGSNWDEVMFQLARWLTRHLNDPKLILWLAKHGGQLHEQFARLVRGRIEYLDKLESDGEHGELDEIRLYAPKAIPGPFMRTLWRLLLSGRLKSRVHDFDLYDWLQRFKQDGLTPTLRIELREILTPRITIREPFIWGEETGESGMPEHIRELVDWELVLSCEYVHSTLRGEGEIPGWHDALPGLLQDFTILLRDALDLKRELGGADDKSDLSYSDQPSISEHPQNKDYRDWTVLIDLARDAWLAMSQDHPSQARLVVEAWWQVPYPLFKRMVFFAVANSNLISPRVALDWLLVDGHWWLWSVETEREMFRLLVALAPKLDKQGLVELERAILAGPPRDMFKDDLESERWQRIEDREMWLRLAEIESTNAPLGHESKVKLSKLGQQYPDWKLAPDERDEFPVWMGGGDEWREFVTAPGDPQDLMEWLKQPSENFWHDDDWRQRCRDDFPVASAALRGLSEQGEWPTKRWREALQAWAEDDLLEESWHNIPAVLSIAPDNVVAELAHSLSWWLKAEAKVFEGQEDSFFSLNRCLLDLDYEDDVDADDDPVFRAINHPIGHSAQALLDWWYRQDLKDAEGLKNEVKPIFTELCDTQIKKFRHGRVLLAAHAITLFRVDEGWAVINLLPLFDWQRSEVEAGATWEGFLWSPRLYRPLLVAFKLYFLETAKHYAQLGKHADQFAAFLTFAALDPGDTFTTKELASATSNLPVAGLQSAAQALTRALEGAAGQHGEYWHNRVLPYLKKVWPKSREVMTPAISAHLGRLCVAAREAFPEAVAVLQYWLQPVEHPDYLVRLLNNANLCEQFPSDTLEFLDAVISGDVQYLPRELKQCLDDIVNSDEALVNDPRFTRLIELCGRRGLG
ncbi:MAG: anti-phage defense-associated sirtuin Dsr1 [Pseudomonadota bacterium]